jgi:hypothetical protein
VSDRLPELLDAKRLSTELGVTRAAAEAIMRRLPTLQIEDLRKVYVRRADVAAYLDARTFAKTKVPLTGSRSSGSAGLRFCHARSHAMRGPR